MTSAVEARRLPQALSAFYTYFDPDDSQRALGGLRHP